MQIEYLQYFLEVASTNSLTKASQNCHTTQQTISNALKTIEKEFGTKIYKRTNYGIYLTKEGEYIKKEVEKILNIYNALLQNNNDNQALCIGSVSIVLPSIISFIADSLTTFIKKEYKNISFAIIEDSSYNATTALLNNLNQDIIIYCIMQTEYAPEILLDNEAYFQEIFYMDEIVILAGKKSPLFSKKTISQKKLKEYPFVFFNDNSYMQNLVPILFPYGLPSRTIQTNNISRLYDCVINDNYLTFAHSISRKNPHYKNKEIQILKLSSNIYVYYIIAIKNEKKEEPYVKAIAEYIKSLII